MKVLQKGTREITCLAVFLLCIIGTNFSHLNAQSLPTVKGMIIDENGVPMPNVTISVMQFKTTDKLKITQTGPQGQFYFYDLPLVYEYMVLVENTNSSLYPPQYWGQEANTKNPPLYPIKLEENFIFSVLIELEQAPIDNSIPVNTYHGAIDGVLRTEDGTPFPNVKVVVTTVSELNPVAETVTDIEGNFILYQVPAGHPHYLHFIPGSNTGYPEQWLGNNNITTKNPNFSLEVYPFDTWMTGEMWLSQNPDTINDTTFNAMIKITLQDSTNNIIQPYGDITLYADWGYVESKNIDPSMSMPIEFYNLPTGNYSIFLAINNYPSQFYNPDGNTVGDFFNFYLSENETKDFYIPLTMHPEDTNAVANFYGSVKNRMGEPLGNAEVAVHRVDDMMWDPWFNIPNPWSEYSAKTDANGNYEIYNVRPGEYVIFAFTENENYTPAFYPNTSNFKEAKRIPIQNYNDTYQLEFMLEKGSSLSGWVKNATTNEGIGKIRVDAYNCMSDNAENYSFHHESKTDVNGFFIMRGLPNGRWHIGSWDEENIYYQVGYNEEDIEITYPQDFQLSKYILMKAGGNLTGKYSIPNVNYLDGWNLGRLFIYPEDFNQVNDTIFDEFEHRYIGIHKENDSSNTYMTEVIPEGKWRMAISPNAWIDHDSIDINKNFIPFLKWKFIDNALTFQSTQPLLIEPYQQKNLDISFETGGYILFGTIKSEKGEDFGWNSITNTWEKNYNIRVFIKDSDELLQVSESFDLRNNRFYIPGLVSGQQYYLEVWADGYPDQWWVTNDSAVGKDEMALPYEFSTSSFKPLTMFLLVDPIGSDDPWDGPSYLKNIKLKPAGLSSIRMSWSPSPPEDKVERYVIFRLKNATEDLFELSEDSSHWKPIDEDSIMSLVDSFNVADTDTFFVDTTAIPFVKYMYVAFGVNAKGNMGEALPAHIPLSAYFTEITYKNFTNSMYVKPHMWQMVGVCGLDSITGLTTTSTTGILEMYAWDETADSTKLYSYYQPREKVTPTRGVWIYSSESIPLKMSEKAFNNLIPKKNNISIKVNEGWNQISSPFPYEVAPLWLGNTYTAWEWIAGENKYIEAKTIKPWKAYWIKSDIAKTLSISHIPAIATKREPSRLRQSIGWELKVSLTGETSSDPVNFIGTLPKELNTILKNTSAEPPPAFDYPHLYFVNGREKCAKLYHYSSVVPEEKIEWKVGISPAAQSMVVTVSSLSSVPEQVSVFWLDNEKLINLRMNNTIEIAPHSETRYGYIIATANPADVALFTGKFRLRPNYPNPFIRSTTLEFTVPYRWNKDGSKSENDYRKIALNVYNVSGRLVATILSGYAKIGHHRRVWDGKSNSGRFLPSGMYIARLTGGDFSKSIRMFKVK